MFTFSPIKQRLDLLTDYVQETTRDGEPLKDDPVVRAADRPAAHRRRGGTRDGAQVRRRGGEGRARAHARASRSSRRRSSASEYKLFATEFSRRLPTRRWTSAGPGSQLRVRTEDAPMKGRSESTYRYTVIDTIGGGASEIQKNIIARRGLGLPKNF